MLVSEIKLIIRAMAAFDFPVNFLPSKGLRRHPVDRAEGGARGFGINLVRKEGSYVDGSYEVSPYAIFGRKQVRLVLSS